MKLFFSTLLAGVLVVCPAAAQPAQGLYAGKTIIINVAGTAGGGFDVLTRAMAKFYSKHIPGHPEVIVKTMPGGGGLVAANHLYNVAPKDGTMLAYLGPIALDPLLNPSSSSAKFDATKFTWVGSLGTSHSVLAVWHTAPAQTAEELLRIETIVAGTGAASTTDFYPKVLNETLGFKFRLITGYQGSQETYLAIERGEAHGRFSSWDSLKSTVGYWFTENKAKVILQAATRRHEDLPNVPTILDLAKTHEHRQIIRFMLASAEARPIAAPPDIPPDRAAALREAFAKLVVDPDYLAEMKRLSLDPTGTMTGQQLQDYYLQVYATPAAIVDRVARAMK
jgi:tripartite-type tricarboxylate transporter receptor subunit TctC